MKPLTLLICLFMYGCGSGGSSPQPAPKAILQPIEKPNVLLIISDDQGVDASAQYSFSNDLPSTPVLDELAAQGLTFETAWATPLCSTTRGAMLTGMHGTNSGIDRVPARMEEDTYILQQHIRAIDPEYQTSVIGKWHLAAFYKEEPDLMHPINSGVGHYEVGPIHGQVGDYFNWDYVQDGTETPTTDYHTTSITDTAIEWMSEQNAKNAPWFLWLAYAAPHGPSHVPPAHLTDRADYLIDDKATIRLDRRPYHLAAVEALDAEIGRLLDSLPHKERQNTVIIFMSDNGTPYWAIDTAAFDETHGKGTLYEGGIRVPLVVSGRGVTRIGEREDAMVNTTDIYATIAQIISPTQPTITGDSFSFKHLLDNLGTGERAYNYQEYEWAVNTTWYSGVGWTARNNQYKLIHFKEGTQELYRVEDVKEEYNLLAEENHTYGLIVGELEAYAMRIRNGEGNGP